MATISASQHRAAELNILARKQRSLWIDAFDRLRRNKAAMGGIFIIAFFSVLAIVAPLLPQSNAGPFHDPISYFYDGKSGPPLRDPAWMADGDPRFILGTDQIGRDMLSRLIWSSRISMVVGLIPALIYFVIGGTVGLVAGYFGGWVDNLLMRFTDIVYAFPDLLLLIIIMATIRDTWVGEIMGGLFLIFAALSVVNWVGVARLTRGQVLSLREKEFVEAARCVGAPARRIMLRHLLPNSLAPIIVALAFSVPVSIFAEAGLSFLGIGIKPPTPSWGVMINEGFAIFAGSPWHVIMPASCIGIIMLAFTFLGDGLRDALDPRMKI